MFNYIINILTKEQRQFVKKCKLAGFDSEQISEIRECFKQGLSVDQVSIFARKEFSGIQIHVLRKSVENGLSIEQIAFCVKKEFDWTQMCQMRIGFEQGLNIKQVSLYARNDLHWSEMHKIRNMLMMNEPFEEVKTKVALMILES